MPRSSRLHEPVGNSPHFTKSSFFIQTFARRVPFLKVKSDAVALNNRPRLSEVVAVFIAASLRTLAHRNYFVELPVWCRESVWSSGRLRDERQSLFYGKLRAHRATCERSAKVGPVKNGILPCAGVGPIKEADINRKIITLRQGGVKSRLQKVTLIPDVY